MVVLIGILEKIDKIHLNEQVAVYLHSVKGKTWTDLSQLNNNFVHLLESQMECCHQVTVLTNCPFKTVQEVRHPS